MNFYSWRRLHNTKVIFLMHDFPQPAAAAAAAFLRSSVFICGITTTTMMMMMTIFTL